MPLRKASIQALWAAAKSSLWNTRQLICKQRVLPYTPRRVQQKAASTAGLHCTDSTLGSAAHTGSSLGESLSRTQHTSPVPSLNPGQRVFLHHAKRFRKHFSLQLQTGTQQCHVKFRLRHQRWPSMAGSGYPRAALGLWEPWSRGRKQPNPSRTDQKRAVLQDPSTSSKITALAASAGSHDKGNAFSTLRAAALGNVLFLPLYQHPFKIK